MFVPFSFWRTFLPSEAIRFIEAHELQTGSTMGEIQKTAVYTLVSMLKGYGTTNGSDLWSKFVANGSSIYPVCPSNGTTASATAYEMELISKTKKGSFVNFLSTDFNNNGYLGGSGKYFDSNTQPSDFPQDDVGYYAWNSSAQFSFRYLFGSTNGSQNGVGFVYQAATRLRFSVNTTYPSSFITVPSMLGFLGVVRSTSTNKRYYQNGSLVINTSSFGGSTTPLSQNVYFSANNLNGTAANFQLARISFMISGSPGFDDAENQDLYEAILEYKTILGR